MLRQEPSITRNDRSLNYVHVIKRCLRTIVVVCGWFVASIAAGIEIAPPTVPEAKSVPAELPLILKTRVPIIFTGEVKEILWTFPGRAEPKPERPVKSPALIISLKVLTTLKSPDAKPLSGAFYMRFSPTFQVPFILERSWEDLSAFVGLRLIFFAYDMTELSAGAYLLNSGYPIKPERFEMEAEVRRFMRLKGYSDPPPDGY